MKHSFIIITTLCFCLSSPILAQTADSTATYLTLDSCLSLAAQNNRNIRKSELAIEKAKQVKAQAFTKYFPQVHAQAGGYYAFDPLVEIDINDIGNASVRDLLTTLYGNYGAALGLHNTITMGQYGYMVGATALQPVYMGGKIVAGNRLAQLGVEAAEKQAEMSDRDLLEQVEESYWLLVGLQEKQATVDAALALIDTIQHIAETAVEAGLVLRTDLMQVELRRSEMERTQIQLSNGIRLATRALVQSVGLPQSACDSVRVPSVGYVRGTVGQSAAALCRWCNNHARIYLAGNASGDRKTAPSNDHCRRTSKHSRRSALRIQPCAGQSTPRRNVGQRRWQRNSVRYTQSANHIVVGDEP